MKYVRIDRILPDDLVKEIQKYIQGEYVYIPSEHTTRKKWGEKSGTRQRIKNRNEVIRNKHESGYTIDELSEEFFLSIDSIKKIVYNKNRNEKLSL